MIVVQNGTCVQGGYTGYVRPGMAWLIAPLLAIITINNTLLLYS